MSSLLGRLQLLVLLILVGCSDSSGADESLKSTGAFTLSSSSAAVEAEIRDYIFLSVEINGATGRFILDTGADAFVVSRAFAENLGLEPVGSAAITTIAGVTRADVVEIAEFRVGNVIGAGINAAVLELGGIDGIIGLPLFKAVVIELDYQSELVVFHDPLEYRLAEEADSLGGTLLPTNDFVLPEIRVQGVDVGRVRIDTGSSEGLRISAEVGRSIPGAEERLPVLASSPNGTVSGEAFIADHLSFGGFELSNQFVVFQQTPLPSGLMGNLVLRQFFMVFDLGSNQILLRRDRILEYSLLENPDVRIRAHGAI